MNKREKFEIPTILFTPVTLLETGTSGCTGQGQNGGKPINVSHENPIPGGEDPIPEETT